MLKKPLKFEAPYVDMQTLKWMLREYRNPKDYIWRLVKAGDLIRLKNGFFVVHDHIKEKPVPFEQLANLLYGPSYVSLEYAMAFYGLIPEAARVCSSMTIYRSKHFYTKIGTFSYYYLSLDRYSVGISHKENRLGGFLIATPEKALADQVFQLCKGLNEKELLVDLIESKRIELSALKNLDKVLMLEIANKYHSKTIRTLANIIVKL